MFKVKNDLLPIRIANHFESVDSTLHSGNSYDLRSNNRTNRVVTRLISSNKSIQVRGENLWQEIPSIIKMNTSLNAFKRMTKCLLVENYC